MSLNKGILHGKEKRRDYRGAKAVDVHCRNHGDCPWCRNNRLFAKRKSDQHSEIDMRNWRNEYEQWLR